MDTKVLFVDDEPAVLRSYQRFMGLDYDVETAIGGTEGLQVIEENGPFGVVISDMRMPGMNGAEFLTIVKNNYPDSIRMLLTGQADMNDTISAVNNGRIFRFLTKPCPPDTLGPAIDEAIELYNLKHAEKELLEKTLKGTINLLADILSIVRPDLFSRSVRIRQLAHDLATALDIEGIWKAEVAALLSQIGCITISQDIIKKRYDGEQLSETDQYEFYKHLPAGQKLLGNIPRLEEISEAISFQEKHFNGGGYPRNDVAGQDIPILARILKVANDFDFNQSLGKSNTAAIGALTMQAGRYDPDVLEALKSLFNKAEDQYIVKEIKAKNVITGMKLAEGVRTKGDLLLVAKGQEISDAMRLCILNFAESKKLIEPIRILVKV